MTEQQKKKREHALRNFDLCNKLLSEGKYNDWVITTAFYSAVQFVEYAVFPLVLKQIEYSDFDEYYEDYSNNGFPNKHAIRKRLVSDQVPKIRTHYRDLFDDCHTARYYCYNTSPSKAIEAKKTIEFIKSECLKIKQ
jgi:hypothetical protein